MTPADAVSVVVPAFNAERVLARALQSVRAQTRPAHEVIVVDDGSTDGTADVVRSYPEATLVQQANRGVSAARNAAIRAATGAWIAILDADDDWLPFKLERQIALLARHRDVMWSACNSDFVFPSGGRQPVMPARLPEPLRQSVVPYFEAVIAGVPFATSGFLIRRDVFERVGPFDESMRVAEERDLFWRIALACPRIAYVHDMCFGYHIGTPDSLTKGSKDRSQSLAMVCANIRRGAAAGVGAAGRRYGRDLALYNYLTRHAAGEIALAAEVAREARELVAPTARERLLLAALAGLPSSVSRRLSRLVQPEFH